MARKIEAYIKLQIPAGQANPSPPVGPALGLHGVNIMEFCKAFNAKTQEMEPGAPCPTIITYYVDKSFSMEIQTPPASFFLKKAAKIDSGAQMTGKETVASVSSRQIREIAEEGLVNLVGGCCGTTPSHIEAIKEEVSALNQRKIKKNNKVTLLSGLEHLSIGNDSLFINIGERTNVTGSKKFSRLIKEKKYDEALEIAKDQVESGAQIIDINMDE